MTTLQLYIATGPASGLDWDDAWSAAVWADGHERAVEVATDAYRESEHYDPRDEPVLLDVDPARLDRRPLPATDATPRHDWPHEERRPQVLRRLGWCVIGESTCSTCGLAPMDMDEFDLCGGCDQCPECGCDCDGDSDPPGTHGEDT